MPPRARWPVAAAAALAFGFGIALAACGVAGPSPTPGHADHDPQADRVRAELTSEKGVVWEPAGPHHVVGRARDGVELDLIGVPVEEVVLSIPARDPELALAYLPHLRDLLHGPDRVYDWLAAMLACRTDAGRSCQERLAQGNLEARFSEGGPGYVVVTVGRR